MFNSDVPSPVNPIKRISIIALFTVLFNILFIPTGSAQAMFIALIFGDKIATEKFHLTIDGGLNITGMPGLDGSRSLIGICYGLGSFIQLSNKWALTPEFKPLSQRGARNVKPLVVYSGISDPGYKFRLNYIDVPILVQYKISPRMHFSAGPQVGFMVSARQIAEGKTVEKRKDIKVSEDVKDYFNKLYFSIPLEFGYIFPDLIPGKSIELKIRYSLGINEVFANASYGSTRFSMLQAMLSFPFIKSPGSKKVAQ